MIDHEPAIPSISVLVPCFNVEKYLRECLDSLCAQTMDNLEIICINDGSTDSTLAIIQNYAARDSRIIIIDKQNSGYGASMNRGLDTAKGEFIGILESDDFIDSTAYETLYLAAKEHEAEVVKSNFFFYWSLPHPRDKFETLITKDIAGPYDPVKQKEIYYLKPTIWSAIYKREFLEKSGIRFLETPGASYQDASFNFKVWASAKKVVLLKEAFLHYRQDNEASSVNSPGKVYCVCDEYAEMQRFIDEHPELKERLQGVLIRMKYDSYMWNYERLHEQFKADFLVRASEEFCADNESGRLDLTLFDYWKDAELNTLMASPETFSLYRPLYAKPGKLNSLKYYYRLGGLPLVKKLVKDRLHRGKA